MDQEGAPRRRSPINALKVINDLRTEKGLARVSLRSRAVTIGPEMRKDIVRQEIERRFPRLLTDPAATLSKEESDRLSKVVEVRLARILSGKEVPPEVQEKPRGRRRRQAAAF